MAGRTITAANAIYMLQIASVFPVPQQLQGFSADDVFDTDPLEVAETSMGIDGRLSAGFVFVAVRQGIQLQADSKSNDVFDEWYKAEQAALDKFEASGIVRLPGLGTKWSMTRGFLTTYPPTPNAGKTLRPRKFYITWERISPALI